MKCRCRLTRIASRQSLVVDHRPDIGNLEGLGITRKIGVQFLVHRTGQTQCLQPDQAFTAEQGMGMLGKHLLTRIRITAHLLGQLGKQPVIAAQALLQGSRCHIGTELQTLLHARLLALMEQPAPQTATGNPKTQCQQRQPRFAHCHHWLSCELRHAKNTRFLSCEVAPVRSSALQQRLRHHEPMGGAT